ncbi:MAG: GNAT family N-acetyltransferase [Lachnospiraceae bacterium]|nr:GNAT family N-acetyltransferase [Lachnospiraceae bacterium]
MIRSAKNEDISQINKLREQVNALHVKGRPDIFKAGFSREFQDRAAWYLQSEDNEIFVDDRDGEIVGMVMVDYISKPESPYGLAREFCHIAEICVDEKWRRKGVAHELMECVRTEARKKGMTKIELDVWAFNDALGFYEAEGFHVFRRFLECDL